MTHPTITHARIDWGKMPVKLLFSYGAVDAFDFQIVRLHAGDAEGLGEVLVPRHPFLDDVLAGLIGTDPRKLDALLPVGTEGLDRIACEAISIALYDLVGHLSGLPMHVLLGGAPTTRVPLMPCIFPQNADDAGRLAASWFDRGHCHLKTKLIGDFAEDLARVEAIHAVAPEGAVLQGDANEGYTTLKEAQAAVERFGRAGLDIFEDPLQGDASAYAELRRRCADDRARIMIDALARTTADLVGSLRAGAADMVGIHPDQPGTLSHALLHAHLARSMNVPVVIGGTGYTGIGTAAYQHLTAVATPGGPCGELGGAFDHGMPHHMASASLPMKDGYVVLPDTPGMGIQLDEEVLSAFATGHAEW